MIYNSGVQCIVCKKANIVCEAKRVPNVPRSELIYGPAGKNQFHHELVFFCEQCRIIYRDPPGKPNAYQEIQKMIVQDESEGSESKAMEKFTDSLKKRLASS